MKVGHSNHKQRRKALLSKTEGNYFECHWCSLSFKKDRATLEHLDEKAEFPNDPSNLALACSRCNMLRGKFQDSRAWAIRYNMKDIVIPFKMQEDIRARGWLIRINNYGTHDAIAKVCLVGKIQREIKLAARRVVKGKGSKLNKVEKFLTSFPSRS